MDRLPNTPEGADKFSADAAIARSTMRSLGRIDNKTAVQIYALASQSRNPIAPAEASLNIGGQTIAAGETQVAQVDIVQAPTSVIRPETTVQEQLGGAEVRAPQVVDIMTPAAREPQSIGARFSTAEAAIPTGATS